MIKNIIEQERYSSKDKTEIKLCKFLKEGSTCPFVKRIIYDNVGNTLSCCIKIGCPLGS